MGTGLRFQREDEAELPRRKLVREISREGAARELDSDEHEPRQSCEMQDSSSGSARSTRWGGQSISLSTVCRRRRNGRELEKDGIIQFSEHDLGGVHRALEGYRVQRRLRGERGVYAPLHCVPTSQIRAILAQAPRIVRPEVHGQLPWDSEGDGTGWPRYEGDVYPSTEGCYKKSLQKRLQ